MKNIDFKFSVSSLEELEELRNDLAHLTSSIRFLALRYGEQDKIEDVRNFYQKDKKLQKMIKYENFLMLIIQEIQEIK